MLVARLTYMDKYWFCMNNPNLCRKICRFGHVVTWRKVILRTVLLYIKRENNTELLLICLKENHHGSGTETCHPPSSRKRFVSSPQIWSFKRHARSRHSPKCEHVTFRRTSQVNTSTEIQSVSFSVCLVLPKIFSLTTTTKTFFRYSYYVLRHFQNRESHVHSPMHFFWKTPSSVGLPSCKHALLPWGAHNNAWAILCLCDVFTVDKRQCLDHSPLILPRCFCPQNSSV